MGKQGTKTIKVNFKEGCLPDYNDKVFNQVRKFYLDSLPFFGNNSPSSTQSINANKRGWKQHSVNKLYMEMMKQLSIEDNVWLVKSSKTHSDIQKKLSENKVHGISLQMNEFICVEKLSSENRVSCIFRHIRNAIAHGRYKKKDGLVLFEDMSRNGKNITGRLLLKEETLISWIEIFNAGNKNK